MKFYTRKADLIRQSLYRQAESISHFRGAIQHEVTQGVDDDEDLRALLADALDLYKQTQELLSAVEVLAAEE